MAHNAVGLTGDEWRILLEAHVGLKQWLAEHQAALDLLDAAERDVLREAMALLDPAHVQRQHAASLPRNHEHEQWQAAGEQQL
jgi:hypothetical protein